MPLQPLMSNDSALTPCSTAEQEPVSGLLCVRWLLRCPERSPAAATSHAVLPVRQLQKGRRWGCHLS